jgi:pyruvate,water dikinase
MPDNRHISWFADIGLQDRPRVGGKGGSLGELQRAGLPVPPGFVVTTSAFEQSLDAIERVAPVRATVATLDAQDLPAIQAISEKLRHRVTEAELPPALIEEFTAAHATLCADNPTQPVAVRSSATTEDASDASFAGLQDTYLWVRGADQILQMIRSCWSSLYSVESISYRRQRQFPEENVAMAVVVQRMVDARSAGVMFTRSPVTGDRSVITIEGSWGLGSAVVGGEVTPDRWVVGKITGEISTRDISDKAIQHLPRPAGGIETIAVGDEQRRKPCINDAELQSLREIARKVERHYGRAQDIEWAVDRARGEIFLLQSRPETVWSMRDAIPVARAADNPSLHVMAIFGGRS